MTFLQFEKILFTIAILVCGTTTCLCIINNLQFTNSVNTKYNQSNYYVILLHAPHMKGILQAYIFAIYFLSSITLLGFGYCIFFYQVEIISFLILGLFSLINLHCLIRLKQYEAAYMVFIDRTPNL